METAGEESRFKKTFNWAAGYFKGNKGYHGTQGYKYKIKLSDTATSGVKVVDTTLGKKGAWIFRMDNPHTNVNFEHVNINPRISGMRDPHLALPTGGVDAGKNVAKLCQGLNTVNKVMLPIAVAVEVIQTGIAVKNDVENKSTRNTVKKVAEAAGGWTCGYGGALGGAAVGSAILPGIGTIVGGIIGGIGGGIGGQLTASIVTDKISDKLQYNLEEEVCEKCKETFHVRKYLGEKDMPLCPKCRRVMKLILTDHYISISSSLGISSGDNFTKYMKKKKSFFSSVVSKILEKKNAAVIIYPPSESEFEYPQISVTLQKEKSNDGTYFTATSKTWKARDVKALTDLTEFELSTVWFLILNTDKDQVNAADFFETIHTFIQKGSESVDGSYQCVGNISNGEEVTWQNPNFDQASKLLPEFDELCTQHGFELSCEDHRKNKDEK